MTLETILYLLLGLALLFGGAEFLVRGASRIAVVAGISPLVVGLTVVAFGTSSPEFAVSVMASFKGEADLALGNVVGSNIFNVLSVLGLGSLLSPHGIPVSSAALKFDLPVMIAIAVACLPIFLFGRISRLNGVLFLGYYGLYLVYLFFSATHHPALAIYQTVLFYGVLPVTALVLLAMGWRALSLRKHGGIAA